MSDGVLPTFGNPVADDRPGGTGGQVLAVDVEPPVELGLLGFGQRNGLGNLGETISEIADQLNPFGSAEVQDILSCDFAHAIIIPHAAA